jgi:hypothetical protein
MTENQKAAFVDSVMLHDYFRETCKMTGVSMADLAEALDEDADFSAAVVAAKKAFRICRGTTEAGSLSHVRMLLSLLRMGRYQPSGVTP